MAGTYTCEATTSDALSGKLLNESATITITVGKSPNIVSKPQNLTVKEGEDVIIDCDAAGDPIPKVNWDKNGRLLDINSSVYLQVCCPLS